MDTEVWNTGYRGLGWRCKRVVSVKDRRKLPREGEEEKNREQGAVLKEREADKATMTLGGGQASAKAAMDQKGA